MNIGLGWGDQGAPCENLEIFASEAALEQAAVDFEAAAISSGYYPTGLRMQSDLQPEAMLWARTDAVDKVARVWRNTAAMWFHATTSLSSWPNMTGNQGWGADGVGGSLDYFQLTSSGGLQLPGPGTGALLASGLTILLACCRRREAEELR